MPQYGCFLIFLQIYLATVLALLIYIILQLSGGWLAVSDNETKSAFTKTRQLLTGRVLSGRTTPIVDLRGFQAASERAGRCGERRRSTIIDDCDLQSRRLAGRVRERKILERQPVRR